MSDDLERIWLNPEGHWSSFDDSEIRHHPSIQYIRFDLYDALVRERDKFELEAISLNGSLNAASRMRSGWQARAEKAEAEVERLREHLLRMLMAQDGVPINAIEFGKWVDEARQALDALQRKEGNE